VEPIPEKTLLRWAESFAGVARTGLGFTDSQYERERFEEVLKIAADIKSAAEEGLDDVLDADGYVTEWMKEVGRGVRGLPDAQGRGRCGGHERSRRVAPHPSSRLGGLAVPDGLVRRWLLRPRKSS
jgi:hypothetical protein